nr:MAG TPA: hypothetical protein [Bacteriophage sp.]DAN33311.1 MAG TPA: hypothetical protein [Caudoviricetes sp.]
MKRYFSELNDGTVIIPAENISADQLEDIIDEAADRVEEETGSREFASLYRDNFAMRLFSEIEEKANEGGEVDIDAAAEDALEDTAAQVEEAEEAETKAQSLYLAGIEAGRRMFAEELEDIEGDIEEEQEEVKQQAYLAGIEAGRRMFSEDLDDVLEGDVDGDEDEVEAVVVQSKLANTYWNVWTRTFSDAKAEGASDQEAAAEATEEASLATDIADETSEDEEAETKVQSLFNANPYLGAFVRAFSEAKEEGANDEEATVEAAKAALDEAGVPNAEVADEEVEAVKVQSYIRAFSDAGLEFTGEDLADLDPELGGQELLDFHQETEDKAEEIAANVNELLDENGFRLEPKADVSGINELI